MTMNDAANLADLQSVTNRGADVPIRLDAGAVQNSSSVRVYATPGGRTRWRNCSRGRGVDGSALKLRHRRRPRRIGVIVTPLPPGRAQMHVPVHP